jgi:dipeptidyl aminopeptidase/acylaminoacyl peptidase
MSLPIWARDQPDRCSYSSNASGTVELHTWDRSTGEHVQATRRAAGTASGALTPDGTALWWFDDERGNERGIWRSQPFGMGPSPDAIPATGLDAGYSTGLAFGADGRVAVGLASDGRHRIFVEDPDGTSTCVQDHAEAAYVGAWSSDGDLLSFCHGEHGNNLKLALRVVTGDGMTVAELWDGPGLGLTTHRWSPVAGDRRLLVVHERRGWLHPAVWSPLAGEVVDLDLTLEGELLSVDWYPAAEAVLVATVHHGRGGLFRHEVGSAITTRVSTDSGTITAARVHPDRTVWWTGSSAASPPAVHVGATVLHPGGQPAPPGIAYEDLLVAGPGGTIHAFLARPEGDGPHPTVFQVHGGPTLFDADAFTPSVQAWVDHGYAVVLVNYRGSTGYGTRWQEAIVGRPGHLELEDLAAVRAHVVAGGVADPGRIVLHGRSWGGYLTLLGLGTQPELWSLGIAVVPIASLRGHYHQQSEPLEAFWRTLFGGTPESLGPALDAIDPVAHVDRIAVPVFVLAGDDDPRCPIEQVLTYVDALATAGVDHEIHGYTAGHASAVVEEQLDHLTRSLEFASRHLGMTPPIA